MWKQHQPAKHGRVHSVVAPQRLLRIAHAASCVLLASFFQPVRGILLPLRLFLYPRHDGQSSRKKRGQHIQPRTNPRWESPLAAFSYCFPASALSLETSLHLCAPFCFYVSTVFYLPSAAEGERHQIWVTPCSAPLSCLPDVLASPRCDRTAQLELEAPGSFALRKPTQGTSPKKRNQGKEDHAGRSCAIWVNHVCHQLASLHASSLLTSP